MLKVMIVDDEQILRTGLRTAFDWKKADCTVVAEADNAIEAFEIYKEIKPDIIITDIRMSKADGLTLIKMLRDSHSKTEIIVLSGYDDFSYAREALENGVFSYLLKPVNFNELYDTLNAVKEKIEKKKKTDIAVSMYTSLKAEQFIISLINGDSYDSVIAKNQELFNKLSGNFFIAAIEVDNKNSLKTNPLSISLSLKECTDYAISTSENYIVKCVIEQTKCILTIFVKDSYSYDSAIVTLNDLLINFNKTSDETITIGISGIFRNLKMVSKAYNQSIDAIKRKAVEGNNRIIDFIKINTSLFGEYALTKENINNIILSIKSGNYDDAKKEINDYFAQIHDFSNISMDSIKSSIAEIAIMIINITANNTDIMHIVFGRIVNPVAELKNIELLDEVRLWILSLVDCLINSDSIYSKRIKNSTVKKAIDYIITHYNKPITIEWVAGQMYVSERHISRLFKAETNMTFNEYLTQYRMQKAINLLKDTEYKIYEIAQIVGYNDSKYFCKLFKKVTGKTPQSFKDE